MMRRRPQHRRHKQKIAVVLNTQRQAAIFPVGQRSAHRGGRIVPDAAPALPADVLVLLIESPKPNRPPTEMMENRHNRPVLVLDLCPKFGAQARRADRTRIPCVGCLFSRRFQRHIMRRCELGPSILERPLAFQSDLALGFLHQRRQRSFRVGRNGQIDFGEAVEFLIVGFGVKIAGGNTDQPSAGLDQGARAAVHLIMERVHHTPQIQGFETQNNIRVRDDRPAAVRLVEGMPRGKIHPPVYVDHRSLQRLGQLDQVIDARLRPRCAVHYDHRILRLHQEPRCLPYRARITLWRRRQRHFRYAQPGPFRNGVFL